MTSRAEPGSDATKRHGRGVGELLVMTIISASLLAAISYFFSGPGRPALTPGLQDHVVLAPRGINWADPTAFAGDWFTEQAPQPHWLFDYLVEAGRASGQLVRLLLAYWLLTCAVFGLATAVLAKEWTQSRVAAWQSLVAVSMLAGFIPFTVAGATWLGFPSAIPNMLGGALLYLLTACLVTGHLRWVLLVLPTTAAVHVQIGAIALILCVLAAAAEWPRLRADRPPARRVGGYSAVYVLSLGIVVTAMRARQVAAERSDFIEICDKLIPYHCAASTWTTTVVLVAIGCALLALAATALAQPKRRSVYLMTVGVCAGGTVAAMFLDRLHAPVLGELIQALNAYRVALALFPYACWGVLVPLLRPAVTRRGALAVFAALAGVPLLFIGPTGKIAFADGLRLHGWAVIAVLGYLALAVASVVVANRVLGARRRRNAGAALMVGLVGWLTAAAAASGLVFSIPPRPSWGDAAAVKWGAAARRILPPGVQVLAPPSDVQYRLPMERGVVVDCKDIPYGGAAYAEWKRRLNALGGWAGCKSDKQAFFRIPAERLIKVADTYGADAIVITKPLQHPQQVGDLERRGWTYERVTAGWMDSGIFLRPGVAHGERTPRP